jgi:2-hydroxy-6-oxonona-2,4-dienedioate hydrolase
MKPAAAQPAVFIDDMLRGARLHNTPCDHGVVQWQEWTCDAGDPTGLPLILLHGGFGSWNHWIKNIPGLRQQRQVWTLDLPGLGGSADLPEPKTPEHFARVLLQGINQLLGPGARFELAGFSFGAMIGARLAALTASRCARFTAIGAAGCGGLHVQVSLLRPPSASTPVQEAHSIHRANLRALMFSGDDQIDELAIYAHGDNLARHRFNSRKLSLTEDFIEALPAIQAKLVGVWGSRDATAGGRANIETRRGVFLAAQPGAEFHILDGVGHWAMYEAPQAINRIILAQ